MKILFCDLLFETGNIHVDNCMIDIMTRDHDVFLLTDESFVSEKNRKHPRLKVLGNQYVENYVNNAFLYYWYLLKRMWLVGKYIRSIKPDLVYISVYETKFFPFSRFLFGNLKKVAIVENVNIDFLQSKLHSLMYRIFAKKVHHIVYEPLFGGYIQAKYAIPEDLIHVIPHIQYANEYQEDTVKCDVRGDVYDCIAISGSNDESLINEIVCLEKEFHYFENHKIKCLIKCKNIQYESGYLKITNSFIPTKEYERLYRECKVVLIPFPLSYKYRMSGCIVDAFSCHKPIVSSNIELAKFYNKQYGNIIKPYSNMQDAINEIINICSNSKENYSFKGFEHDHSEVEVERSFNDFISKL